MGLVFFNRPKPRRFDYKPVYYDQEKEELEERKKELGKLSEGDPHARLKADIRRRWHRGGERKTSERVIRSIFYMLIIILATYFIFFTNVLQNLLSVFTVN